MPCHRSGECCRKLAVTVNPGPDMIELMRAWGILGEDQTRVTMIVWQDCQHWDQDTRLCRIYDNRPKICREFLCTRARQNNVVPVKIESTE